MNRAITGLVVYIWGIALSQLRKWGWGLERSDVSKALILTAHHMSKFGVVWVK